MERYPACGQGTLQIVATITHAEVIRKMLHHLKRATESPPVAPARGCHTACVWPSP